MLKILPILYFIVSLNGDVFEPPVSENDMGS